MMTPHHQPAMWKKRSPVLSGICSAAIRRLFPRNAPACHAFTQQTMVAKIHGGLGRCSKRQLVILKASLTDAASNKLIMGLNPSVDVNLEYNQF